MYFKEINSGSSVRFKLSSVICPEQDQIKEKITGKLDLTGKVVQLSDAGDKQNYYAVIHVGGIMVPLIVPVDQIELCSTSSGDEVLI